MYKILYVVSTLKRSGPTNQLYNIVNNLDLKLFSYLIVTLSSEPKDSMKSAFLNVNSEIYSLNFSRLGGLLRASLNLKNIIAEYNPDIIHSQGIRSDKLISTPCTGTLLSNTKQPS